MILKEVQFKFINDCFREGNVYMKIKLESLLLDKYTFFVESVLNKNKLAELERNSFVIMI